MSTENDTALPRKKSIPPFEFYAAMACVSATIAAQLLTGSTLITLSVLGFTYGTLRALDELVQELIEGIKNTPQP